MRRIGMTPDARAMTAVDYANISEDKTLQELVSKVIGDKLLQVKPKSLMEVEEKIEQSQMSETMKTTGGFSPTNKTLAATTNSLNAPALKQNEVAIFNRQYHVEQNLNRSVPSDFLDQQRALKTQRELETQKKFLQ